eukprot:4678816-Amphidinium_carterae.1
MKWAWEFLKVVPLHRYVDWNNDTEGCFTCLTAPSFCLKRWCFTGAAVLAYRVLVLSHPHNLALRGGV